MEEAIAWVWVVDAMDGSSKDWRSAAEDVAGDIGRGGRSSGGLTGPGPPGFGLSKLCACSSAKDRSVPRFHGAILLPNSKQKIQIILLA